MIEGRSPKNLLRGGGLADWFVEADSLAAALERFPFVADALSVLELTTPPPADSSVVLMRNSHRPDRWVGGSGRQGFGVVFAS